MSLALLTIFHGSEWRDKVPGDNLNELTSMSKKKKVQTSLNV